MLSLTPGILSGAEATKKRFWKTASVDNRGDSFAILLDRRTLKTPDGKPLILPASKQLLATLIAHEWETQETLLKPHALPMVNFASETTLCWLTYIHGVDFAGIESYRRAGRRADARGGTRGIVALSRYGYHMVGSFLSSSV